MTFNNTDGDESKTMGSAVMRDAQITAGGFHFLDLDLDPLEYGGNLTFNVTEVNGNASDLTTKVNVYLATDDVYGYNKQLVVSTDWSEVGSHSLWVDGATGINGERRFTVEVPPEAAANCGANTACHMHVRFEDAYGG